MLSVQQSVRAMLLLSAHQTAYHSEERAFFFVVDVDRLDIDSEETDSPSGCSLPAVPNLFWFPA